MFGYFWKSKEKKAVQFSEDLTRSFPNFLDIAKGWNGIDKVPDCVAYHPVILGFLYGFSFMVVTTASRKTRFDDETQYKIMYQAICNFLNRPSDFEDIGWRIIRFEDTKNAEFQEYFDEGKNLAHTIGWMAITGRDPKEDVDGKILLNILQGKVYKIMEESGVLPQFGGNLK